MPTLTPTGSTQSPLAPLTSGTYTPPSSQAQCTWNPVVNPTWNWQHNPFAWLVCNLTVTEHNFQTQPGDRFGAGLGRALASLSEAEVSLLSHELQYVYALAVHDVGILPWPPTPDMTKADRDAENAKVLGGLRGAYQSMILTGAASLGAQLGARATVPIKALTTADLARQTLKEQVATGQALAAQPVPGTSLTDPEAREIAQGLHATVRQIADHLAAVQRARRVALGLGLAAVVGVTWAVVRRRKQHAALPPRRARS